MNFLIKQWISLRRGMEDPASILSEIRSASSFRGANLWTLAAAIIIASVGLNVNSTAVIIGAMLISPLMGPIVASGFALATFNISLLRYAARNLLLATFVSLSCSFAYFLISPFKQAQSELLARVSPNVYDILIAFCGGLVGAIAITRTEKGNPIPGVAIATALMPPLCTAGYGLATGHLDYFLGAFYLYLINCIFICLSTYLVARILRFPVYQATSPRKQLELRMIMTILVIGITVPSVFFAYRLYKEKQYEYRINDFFEEEFTAKGYTLVFKKTKFNSKPKLIELAFLSKRFTSGEINELNRKLNTLPIPETRLVFRQDSTDRVELLRKTLMNEIKAVSVSQVLSQEADTLKPAAPPPVDTIQSGDSSKGKNKSNL